MGQAPGYGCLFSWFFFARALLIDNLPLSQADRTSAAKISPIKGTKQSHTGTKMFPRWEHSSPQRGNLLPQRLD